MCLHAYAIHDSIAITARLFPTKSETAAVQTVIFSFTIYLSLADVDFCVYSVTSVIETSHETLCKMQWRDGQCLRERRMNLITNDIQAM